MGRASVSVLQDFASAGGNMNLLLISVGAGAFQNEFAASRGR